MAQPGPLGPVRSARDAEVAVPDALVDRLIGAIEKFSRATPLRVAIDGPDAAGKSTLADRLAGALGDRGRPVLRASIDGFHRPRAERYRLGELSPEGCFRDSFDLEALHAELLGPLGVGGSRRYRESVFDHEADVAISSVPRVAPEDAVLVFDGVFLLRRELLGCWDLRIFLSVGVGELLRRARRSKTELFGSAEEVERRYRLRYIPAQRLYMENEQPLGHAHVVVENDDPAHPLVVRWELPVITP
jgi:uridine kinase